MLTTVTIYCFRCDTRQSVDEEFDFPALPHKIAIALDLVTGVALLILGSVFSSMPAAHALIGLGSAQLAPLLFTALWSVRAGLLPDRYLNDQTLRA